MVWLIGVTVALGPAAYVIIRLHYSEDFGDRWTIALVLAWTGFCLFFVYAQLSETGDDLIEVCEHLNQEIIDRVGDPDSAYDYMPSECYDQDGFGLGDY